MRNGRLRRTLQLHDLVVAGQLTGIQALQQLIIDFLEPKERSVLHFVGVNLNCTSPEVAAALGMSEVHAATVLKRLYDLRLLERNEVITPTGRIYQYRSKL